MEAHSHCPDSSQLQKSHVQHGLEVDLEVVHNLLFAVDGGVKEEGQVVVDSLD